MTIIKVNGVEHPVGKKIKISRCDPKLTWNIHLDAIAEKANTTFWACR